MALPVLHLCARRHTFHFRGLSGMQRLSANMFMNARGSFHTLGECMDRSLVGHTQCNIEYWGPRNRNSCPIKAESIGAVLANRRPCSNWFPVKTWTDKIWTVKSWTVKLAHYMNRIANLNLYFLYLTLCSFLTSFLILIPNPNPIPSLALSQTLIPVPYL